MNKVKYGLSKVHYAVITKTSGAFTYGTPKPIPGAVNLSLAPKGDTTEFYADNKNYFPVTANEGYTGNLEIALIPDDFLIDVMGFEEDDNKALFEPVGAIPKAFALMWQFEGDANAVRHVLYNVTAARPNTDGGTKQSGITPQTDTLAITALPAEDTRYVKAKAGTTSAGYDTWFNEVYTFGSETEG